jgi:transcription antitermination factor NusG
MSLLPPSEGEGPLRFPWYALRLRSRSEHLADQLLKARGVETFLPTYRARRVWSDRIKILDLPLYPGYLFCRFEYERRLPILQCSGVVDVVSDGRKGLVIPEEEIMAVRKIVQSELRCSPWPFLKAGQRVEIHKGPLRGIEGTLLVQKKNYRLVVSIPLLQRSVNVEIEEDWVRPLSSSIRAA